MADEKLPGGAVSPSKRPRLGSSSSETSAVGVSEQSNTAREIRRRTDQPGPSMQTPVEYRTPILNRSQTQEQAASMTGGFVYPHNPTTVMASSNLVPSYHSSTASSNTFTASFPTVRPSFSAIPPGSISPATGVQHTAPVAGNSQSYNASPGQTQSPGPSLLNYSPNRPTGMRPFIQPPIRSGPYPYRSPHAPGHGFQQYMGHLQGYAGVQAVDVQHRAPVAGNLHSYNASPSQTQSPGPSSFDYSPNRPVGMRPPIQPVVQSRPYPYRSPLDHVYMGHPQGYGGVQPQVPYSSYMHTSGPSYPPILSQTVPLSGPMMGPWRPSLLQSDPRFWRAMPLPTLDKILLIGASSDHDEMCSIYGWTFRLSHAISCQKREREQQQFQPCTAIYCSALKTVLNHMTGCQAGRDCTFPHCASSRQIIFHMKNCQQKTCPICVYVRLWTTRDGGIVVRSMQSSDEAADKTLQDLKNIFCNSSFHPLRTTIELKNKGILDDDVYHVCRRGDLTDVTKRFIILNSLLTNGEPGVFQTFVAILESDPVNADIVKKLRDEYQRRGGNLAVWNSGKDCNDDATYHSSKLEQLMDEKGELTLSVVQCMPFGPPRIGKTCVKDRLAGKKPKGKPAKIEGGKVVYPNEVSCSTGAAEDVLRLNVEPCKPLTFQEQGERWVLLDFNQEVISLVKGLGSLLDPTTTCSKSSTMSHESQFSELLELSISEEILVNESLSTGEEPQVSKSSNATDPVEASTANSQVDASTANSQVEPSTANGQVEHSSADGEVESDDQVEPSSTSSPVQSTPNINPLQTVKDAFLHGDPSCVTPMLKGSLTIHFTDTGGQPEFQEVLPALVSGPSLFLLTFSLANGLSHQYEVRYDTSDDEIEPFMSNFTVMDILLQCLASIACIGTQRKQGGEIKVIKPKVFFIGTQRDLVSNEQVQNIDRELREAIDKQGLMEMVEPHSRQQLLFAVNNYSNEDENFETIRKAVHAVARREEEIYKVRLPAPFVTLDFYLRQPIERPLTPEVCQNTAKKYKTTVDALREFVHSLHKQIKSTHQAESISSVDLTDPKTLAFVAQTLFEPSCAQLPVEVESLREALLELNELSHCREDVITMEQFKAIAKECKITAEECKEALWALHHLLGTLRHFAVGNLKDLVITNPQLFFNVVTKLITSTFALKRNREYMHPKVCMRFYEKGIFTVDDLDKVWSQEKSHLSSEHLVTLLTYLHIIAPMEYEGKPGYFLPCVLTHAPHNESIVADKHIVAPLLVSFDCGFTPKGIFSGLLAYLLQHAGEDGLLWKLQEKKLFRDQASLYVKPRIYLTITARPDFIRFSLHQEKRIDLTSVCTTIKGVIEKGLNEVASRLNYTVSAQPRFGFECTCDDQKLHFTKYESCDTECLCFVSGMYCDVPSDYLIWFEDSPRVPSASLLSEERELLHRPLDITHLFEVFEVVRSLTDWMRLGLALGLHYPTLSKIKHDHSIIDECKLEMLAAWLQQQDGVPQQGVPSLSRLKAALRRIGENMIADKISFECSQP